MRLFLFRELLSQGCINLQNLCAHQEEELLAIPKRPQPSGLLAEPWAAMWLGATDPYGLACVMWRLAS